MAKKKIDHIFMEYLKHYEDIKTAKECFDAKAWELVGDFSNELIKIFKSYGLSAHNIWSERSNKKDNSIELRIFREYAKKLKSANQNKSGVTIGIGDLIEDWVPGIYFMAWFKQHNALDEDVIRNRFKALNKELQYKRKDGWDMFYYYISPKEKNVMSKSYLWSYVVKLPATFIKLDNKMCQLVKGL